MNLTPAYSALRLLPAGSTVADITYTIGGIRKYLGGGAPEALISVDQDKWNQVFGFDSFQYCGVECGAPTSRVREWVSSAYLMTTFNTSDILPFSLRGDAGPRYVKTSQRSAGYVPTATAAGSTYPTQGVLAELRRSYEDFLPSANLVLDITHDLLLRASAASVMSRPELGALAGYSTVNATPRTATTSNPLLDPIRADTLDLAVELYFAPTSLLSMAYFRKNITTYIQTTSTLVPFDQLGLPDSLLVGTPSIASDLFTVTRQNNTQGGPLKGGEANVQMPLRFLPSFVRNFGVLANHTRVTSRVRYVLQSVNGVPTLTTTADLLGLSRKRDVSR